MAYKAGHRRLRKPLLLGIAIVITFALASVWYAQYRSECEVARKQQLAANRIARLTGISQVNPNEVLFPTFKRNMLIDVPLSLIFPYQEVESDHWVIGTARNLSFPTHDRDELDGPDQVAEELKGFLTDTQSERFDAQMAGRKSAFSFSWNYNGRCVWGTLVQSERAMYFFIKVD